MHVKIYLPSLSGCVWILKQGDPQQQLQFLPILAPFLSRAITADVFLQPTARSKGRIPLQSTCSTDAPWSTKYCTYNRNMEHRIKFPYYINQKEPNSSLVINNKTIIKSKFLLCFTDHFRVTAKGSKIQRCASTAVSMGGGCTSVHQLSDKLELSF